MASEKELDILRLLSAKVGNEVDLVSFGSRENKS
jgi:hypothetical protein